VPAIPLCIIEPIWDQFQALLPPLPTQHPLGCHRPRVADRLVFDKMEQVLDFGCAYARIADDTCSATTLRRRDAWIGANRDSSARLWSMQRGFRWAPSPPRPTGMMRPC
jgi:hypothetical protein